MTAVVNGDAKTVAKALITPVNAVLLAQVYHEVTRERCEAIQRRLLATGKYGPCRDPRKTWLPKEDGGVDGKEYYADLDAAYREAGYVDLSPGYCPALIAEDLLRVARRTLVECAQEFFPGITPDRLLCAGLAKYDEFIELLIKLVVNAPGYQKPTPFR